MNCLCGYPDLPGRCLGPDTCPMHGQNEPPEHAARCAEGIHLYEPDKDGHPHCVDCDKYAYGPEPHALLPKDGISK